MNTQIIPNFFIVGAPKCGTTALYEYLRRHPQIFMSERKEPGFFGQDLRRVRWKRPSLDEYLSLFREATLFLWRGEASTMYLVSRSAAIEIKDFSPESKIIIMVRDPVEAMYSMHSELISTFSEDILDFYSALKLEQHRAKGDCLPKYCGYQEQSMYRHQYRYVEQIERYANQFTWSRVHVVLYDDFKADANKVYQGVLSFLGVDPYSLSEYPRVNVSKRRRVWWIHHCVNSLPSWYRRLDTGGALIAGSFRRRVMRVLRKLETSINVAPYRRPPLPEGLERSLRRELAPEVERLGNLLGRDLSHWTRMPAER